MARFKAYSEIIWNFLIFGHRVSHQEIGNFFISELSRLTNHGDFVIFCQLSCQLQLTNWPMTKLPLNILTSTLTIIGRDKKILNISPTFQLNISGYFKISDPFSSRERRKTDCLWIGVVPVKQTFSVNSTIFIDELESKFGIFH